MLTLLLRNLHQRPIHKEMKTKIILLAEIIPKLDFMEVARVTVFMLLWHEPEKRRTRSQLEE